MAITEEGGRAFPEPTIGERAILGVYGSESFSRPFHDFFGGVSSQASACWARRKGYCKRGSGGQRKAEKIRATFWDSKLPFAAKTLPN